MRTWSGFCFVAFIVDVYARGIVGWQATRHLRTDLALDALEQAIWARKDEDLWGLVHHSDRGVQYLAIRYTERLAETGVVNSVGCGDSYDNALAESINGLYKTELVRDKGTRGAGSTISSSPRWNGSTGSTTAGSSKTTVASHPPSSKPTTTVRTSQPPRPRPKPTSLHETRGGSLGQFVRSAR